MAGKTDIIMPKMGDAMDDGKIVQWLKKVGDAVKEGDAVAEIETDKSNVEIESTGTGFIQTIIAQPGETIAVGKVIATIGDQPTVNGNSATTTLPTAEAMPATTTELAEQSPTEEKREEQEVAVSSSANNGVYSNGVAPTNATTSTMPAAKSAPVVVTSGIFKPYNSFVGGLPENLGGSASLIGEPIALSDSGNGERVRATPLARVIAQSNNIDLSGLKGSGSDGGIVRADVEAALTMKPAVPTLPTVTTSIAAAPTAAAVTLATANDGDTVQDFSGMRKVIARRLVESKSTIPHFYVSAEIDMESLIALRERINTGAGDNQPKVSINDCLMKAVAVALTEHPRVNAAYGDNKRILRKAVNVGFGVALEDGLIVPVVKDCHNKSLRAIARETKPLIEKARAGKLAPQDYSGGTFTISNLGVYADITDFGAIINPGEGAILAVASTRPVPVVVDDELAVRKRMKVTLSGDHRIMDGADGAQFLLTLKRIVENPLEMLA